MNVRKFSMVLALVALSTSSIFAQGQYDFFFSFNDIGGGVENGDASMNFEAGDTGSLFLYYSTDGPSQSELSIGFFTNIMTSASGVIEFTAAQTFDYDISIAGTSLGNRWDTPDGGFAGDAVSVTSDFITDLRAFTVTGDGIINANAGSPFTDAGYDASANAFQLGRIDFTVLGSLGPGGTSVDVAALLTQAVNGSVDFSATASVGGATINVSGVPEPTSAGLLALGLVGLVARRRR